MNFWVTPLMYNQKTAERQKRYLQTDKGKESNRRSSQKYAQSEVGKEKRRERNRRYYAKLKAMRLNNELSEFVEEVPYDS